MYYIASPLGCLIWTILLIWVFFALKLYYVVFFVVLFAIIYSIFRRVKVNIQNQKIIDEMNFEPKMGEVSKICPSCGKDVRRSTEVCPNCGYKFD